MPHAKELKAVSRSDTNGIIDPYDPDNVQINPGSYGEDSTDYGSLELPEASYSENLEGETMSKRLKLFKTCSMMLIYAGMGFWAGVVSPTSIDMSELYDITLEKFVRASSAKSLGVLTGCFTGALLADKLRSKADLGLCISNLIGGVTILAVPLSPNIAFMAIMFFINGICHGTQNVVCSSINLAIWGPAAPTPIHCLHMCFTIGTTFAPMITVPFLSNIKRDNLTGTEVLDLGGGDNMQNGSHIETTPYTGHVSIAYAIFGVWSIAVALLFGIMFFKSKPYSSGSKSGKKLKVKEIINPARLSGGSLKYGIFFLVSLFLLYVLLNGRDRGMSMYLFVIAHEDILQMSKPMAAVLVTSYNMFQAVGRGIGALISHWLPIKPFVFVQLLISSFLQLLLFFYGLESNATLWILSALFGIVAGPTYPSIMSWADRYVEASGVVIAVIDIGIGLGGFIALWLYGHTYETSDSVGVFLLGLVYGIILLAILIPLQIASSFHGDRHKNATISANTVHIPSTRIQDFRLPDEDENSPLLTD